LALLYATGVITRPSRTTTIWPPVKGCQASAVKGTLAISTRD
jgi:hypothetical protein